MNPLQLHIKTSIEKSGFAVIAVHDDQLHTTFAYSVGFTELNHPEVVIYGMSQQVAHQFMWSIYDAIKKGKHFEPDVIQEELANLPCVFKRVTAENAREHCCQGVYWYEPVEYLQMVMPDKEGKLPWQKGYDADLMRCQKELWERLQ